MPRKYKRKRNVHPTMIVCNSGVQPNVEELKELGETVLKDALKAADEFQESVERVASKTSQRRSRKTESRKMAA